MDINLTELIVGVVAAIVTAGISLFAKNKSDKLNTTKELIAEISEALEDDKITKEEMIEIFEVIKKF